MHDLIISSNRGDFNNTPFTLSSSIASKLFPFIHYYNKNLEKIINIKEEIVTYYTYSKPLLKREQYIDAYTISEIKTLLKTSVQPKTLRLTKFDKFTNVVIYVGKGFITDEKGKILLCLCTNEVHYQKQDVLYPNDIANNNEHNRIAHEHFTLLISNDLAYNKKYANFYKELCKEYIEILQNHDVEIRFLSTSKIDKLCYANDYQFKFTRINSFFDYQSILRKLITDEEQLNFSEFDVNFVEAPIIISEEQGDLLFGVLQTVSIHESRISSQEYWYNIENPRYIPKSRINRHRQYRLIDDTPNPVDMDNNPLLPPGTIIGTLEVNDNSFQLTMNNGTSLYRESDDSLVNSVAEDINSSFVGYNQTIEAGLIAEEQISSSSQINAINTVMINNEVRQVATNIDGLEFLVPRDYEDYEEENESHEEEVEAPYGNEEEEYEDEHPFL